VPPKFQTLPLFKGPTSKGMEGNGSERGRKGKGVKRGEVEGGIWPTQKFWCGAPMLNRPARGAISGLFPACGVLVPINKEMYRAFSWSVTVCRGFN